MSSFNVHGTAIVVGTTGFLLTGPSGIGKSALAFACISTARARGLFSALIADDQVLLSLKDGHIIAEAPVSIAGMLELRGTGIIKVDFISPALVHSVVRVVDPAIDDRLPPANERCDLGNGLNLPMRRLSRYSISPLDVLLAEILPNA